MREIEEMRAALAAIVARLEVIERRLLPFVPDIEAMQMDDRYNLTLEEAERIRADREITSNLRQPMPPAQKP